MKVCVTAVVNSSTPEDNLIEAARGGDIEAFGELFERYRNAVYSLCATWIGYGPDAQDVVQETFCRAWRSISSFRGDAKLVTWLYRIAANLCADHGRRLKRQQRLGTKTSMESCELARFDGPGGDPESESIDRQAVRDALSALSESHRAAVVLCEVQGLTCYEAATVLGRTPVSVRVGLYHARKRLRKLLGVALGEGE